jgi:DtxR family Mn-dependent transcriptional regulator
VLDRAQEEILESLWVLREEGLDTRERLLAYSNLEEPAPVIEALIRAGLLAAVGERIVFTPEGEREGAMVTRRHRLAERLLADVLRLEDDRLLESTACDWEHVLNPDVTESICTLLGHPPACPHGRPIPPGECCRRPERAASPVIVRLADLSPGREATVTFVASSSRRRMERLLSLGIAPGTKLRLVQRRPAHVIAVGETTLAIDREIASEIFVRPARSAAEDPDPSRKGDSR